MVRPIRQCRCRRASIRKSLASHTVCNARFDRILCSLIFFIRSLPLIYRLSLNMPTSCSQTLAASSVASTRKTAPLLPPPKAVIIASSMAACSLSFASTCMVVIAQDQTTTTNVQHG